MNLTYMPKGSTRWTADRTERVRIEFRVGDTDEFECAVFNTDGEHIGTRRYNIDGTALNSHDEGKDLINWN